MNRHDHDERPVGFTDLRQRPSIFSQTAPTKQPETLPTGQPAPRTSHAVPSPPPSDPTMSAAVVARARAQLAAANGNQPVGPAGPVDVETLGDWGEAAGEPAGPATGESAVRPEDQPADRVAAEPVTAAEPTAADPVTAGMGSGGRGGSGDPTGGSGDLTGGSGPDLGPESWRGYDPDFVADRMVPIMHARATRGWRARLGMRPSRAEEQASADRSAMCVNFGRPVKIVVANPRGYAGKTSMTLGLAGALGLARGGRVCAYEDHELRGTMALRTVENGTQRTTRNFINDLSQMSADQVRHADLSRYVRHQMAGQFDAMVTSRNREKQLSGDEYRAGIALLERFYEVVVVDTANNEGHEAFRAAIDSATVLVVPVKWRPTHVVPATQMLADLAGSSPAHRRLVQNAVIVASHAASEAIVPTRSDALPMFEARAHAVVEIPPDAHIDADRPIVHDQLARSTRTAFDRLGAAVCDAAIKNIRTEEQELT